MKLTNEEAKTIWYSMSNKELNDYVESKFESYRELGYTVGHFRSSSSVYVDEITITTNKLSYHEVKTIHDMDEFLKIV